MVRDGAAGGGIAGNAVFLKHIIKALKTSEFIFISTGYIAGRKKEVPGNTAKNNIISGSRTDGTGSSE